MKWVMVQHKTGKWGCSRVILVYIVNLTQVGGGITGVNGVMHKEGGDNKIEFRKEGKYWWRNGVLFNLLAWGGV